MQEIDPRPFHVPAPGSHRRGVKPRDPRPAVVAPEEQPEQPEQPDD